jgi:hypothetical protein
MALKIDFKKFGALASAGKFLKWFLVALSATLCGILVAGIFWLYLNPLSRFEAKIKEKIQAATGAEKVYWRELRWSFTASQLGLGLLGRDLVLENGKGFKRILLPELKASVSVWRLVFLRVPLEVHVKEPLVHLAPKKEENPKADTNIEIPSSLSYLRLGFRIEKGRVVWDTANENEIYDIKNIDLRSSFSGIPGSFDLKLNFDPVLHIPSKEVIVSKGTEIKLKGALESFAGKLGKFEFTEIDVDLSRNLILAASALEKVPETPLRFGGKASLLVNKDLSVDSFFTTDSRLTLSSLTSKLNVHFTHKEKTRVEVALGRGHYKDLHLPFKHLRSMPMKGAIEWNVVYEKTHGRSPLFDWKISFNNLSSDVSHLDTLVDSSSAGPFIFSLLSEGRYQDGFVLSPRIEMQTTATEAAFSFRNGQIQKRKNEKFEIFMKAFIKDDVLELEKIYGKVHTLDLQGRGKIEKFSSWIKGGPAPAKFAVFSNRVHLRDWSAAFQFINQSPPLEGFFEFAGDLDAQLQQGKDLWSAANWRIDRAYLANVKGVLNSKELMKAGFLDPESALEGAFAINMLCNARGVGSQLHKASVKADVDLSDTSFVFKKKFLKERDVPLRLTASFEAARNEIRIQQGDFRFHTLLMNLAGKLRYGSQRSLLLLDMKKPIELGEWRKFFPQTKVPLEGRIHWKGWLGFSSPEETFSGDLDLKKIVLKGALTFSGIKGKLPDSNVLLRDANARILFSEKSLGFDKSFIRWDDNRVDLSGSSVPLKNGSSWLSLADMMSHKTWEHKYQLKLQNFSPSEDKNAKADPKAEKPFDLIELLKHPYVKGSVYDLSFSIGQGLMGGIPFSNLESRLLWKDSQLVLNPFSLKALSGEVGGSAAINAQDFYLRNQDPTFSSTIKVKNLSVNGLTAALKPELQSVVGGLLDGTLILSSQGILFDDLIKKSSGRLQGKLRDGYFETFKVLKGQIDERVKQNDLNRWLAREAQRESCLQSNFGADLDAEIQGGNIQIAQSLIAFTQTKSSIRMQGKIASDLSVDMKGNFYAGEGCLSGDVRQCLQRNKEGAAVPFFLSGPAASAEAKLDYAGLTRQIASCVKDTVKSEVKERVQSELKNNGQIKKLQNQAADKLKNIFKGR